MDGRGTISRVMKKWIERDGAENCAKGRNSHFALSIIHSPYSVFCVPCSTACVLLLPLGVASCWALLVRFILRSSQSRLRRMSANSLVRNWCLYEGRP